MSETKPTEEAGAPLAQEAAEKAVQLSEAGGELRVEIRNTFSEVISDKTLVQIWGKDGKLSEGRAGFAAAVVAMMQDRLLQQLDEHRKEQLSMAGQVILLLNRPMFGAPPNAGAAPENVPAGKRSKRSILDYITWQNFLGGGGVVAVAIALLVTGMTSNYKNQYESTSIQLKEAHVRLQQAQSIVVNLTAEKVRAETDAANFKKQLEASRGSADDQKAEQDRLMSENSDLRAANARLTERAGFNQQWDVMLEQERKRKDEADRDSKRQRERAERAEKLGRELQAELDALKKERVVAQTKPTPTATASPSPAP